MPSNLNRQNDTACVLLSTSVALWNASVNVSTMQRTVARLDPGLHIMHEVTMNTVIDGRRVFPIRKGADLVEGVPNLMFLLRQSEGNADRRRHDPPYRVEYRKVIENECNFHSSRSSSIMFLVLSHLPIDLAEELWVSDHMCRKFSRSELRSFPWRTKSLS